jgi:predicted dehydrogenase
MKAVIVGAGASGVLHALALRAAGVEIEAVYDTRRERARALAEVCGGRVIESVASAQAEVAAVCSPPGVHAEQVEMLAARGRVVLVEKPVATTREGLERMAELPGVIVPILQWRSGRALRALRRAVAAGEFGESPVVACDLAWSRDEDYFEARKDWGCGALLSIGIHAIDAVTWALDREIERVASVASKNGRSAVALLGFVGGAMASVRISLEGGANSTRMTFCGGGRTAFLEGPEADPTCRELVWAGRDAVRLRALEGATPGARGSPLLVPYIASTLAALRDGEAPFTIADTFSAHAAAIVSDREPALEQLADVTSDARLRVRSGLDDLCSERV